ncbi:MAG TPA: alpha-glucan family phosphorylase [Anaerolineales bacterium]|nr:alpha-glucan family phosphorylase [Anaerolineales bacterium]
MQKFRSVIPNHFTLPKRISRLGDLAYNLWWTWNPEAQRLFDRIDRDLWEQAYHNPVQFLKQVPRARLNSVSQDLYFLKSYDRVFQTYDDYLTSQDTWYAQHYPDLSERQIAYFSMEFGLHETLPLYAGGLGVLSGDHLKEASDMGLPMVGIGFLYTRGYVKQRITEDGWQENIDFSLQVGDAPISPLLDSDGNPLKVSISLPDREIHARLWEVRVGRIPLYLMDSDIPENSHEDRSLTIRLYSGDPERRIVQEMLLGIGGVRAIRLLGFKPEIWHMNEGHSAFLVLECAREYVSAGQSFDVALERVRQECIFTTHTPVPAGNDEFQPWLVDKFFSNFWSELGLERDEFNDLARNTQPWGETFSMPVLALRGARYANGVSELHGVVARRMWGHLWPELKEDEVPITHVTNGVHIGTWLARRMGELFATYLDKDWEHRIEDPELWERIDLIPDEELWAVRRHLKRKLMAYVVDRARMQWIQGELHPIQLIASGALLDPYSLTIGFARRFAPYKRANLVLSDLDRLLSLLNRPNMPVQIIFAGKTHPDNEPGKQLIQEVYRAVKLAGGGGRLVFLEDYDMNVARYLVQGVDVWLNTPLRPNEASGTSGQKVALNGGLNFSIMDGWWREGYNGRNGWAIGNDTNYDDPNQQDAADVRSLYETLEGEIIPLYYRKRSSDGLPGDWLAWVKESIRTLAPQFSTRRMLLDYLHDLYVPAIQAKSYERLQE